VQASDFMCKTDFMCKAGERVRSKTATGQINEVLCKVLAHNLCCLIQSIYELGIEVDFRAG
jgi:hypothetical protein